jgi:cell division protein FtsZ
LRRRRRWRRSGRFYKNDSNSKKYKRRPHIYLFSPEDLDNDDVISAVESTPTYKRTREILDNIHSQASGDDIVPSKSDDAREAMQGTIKFA